MFTLHSISQFHLSWNCEVECCGAGTHPANEDRFSNVPSGSVLWVFWYQASSRWWFISGGLSPPAGGGVVLRLSGALLRSVRDARHMEAASAWMRVTQVKQQRHELHPPLTSPSPPLSCVWESVWFPCGWRGALDGPGLGWKSENFKFLKGKKKQKSPFPAPAAAAWPLSETSTRSTP